MTHESRLKAKVLSKVFGWRMTLEQYFRDTKSNRNGSALHLIQIQDSERLSWLLLVRASAYLLLATIGLYASKKYRPGLRCSNNRLGECSLFTIGKLRPFHPLPSLQYLLLALRRDILKQNWG